MADTLQRPTVIAGNWKMHKGPSETAAYFREFLDRHPVREDRIILIFPPAVSLVAAAGALGRRGDIAIGVQNIHWEPQGAFTGEISVSMARDAGARYTLVGHSERRHIFGETDEQVRRKTAAALAGGITPVVCLGETLEQREAGRVEDVILGQLDAVLDGLDAPEVGRILIAYEPVWAIGTGVNATPEDAAAAHGVLRRRLEERVGAGTAGGIPILYGGSVNPGNAGELLAASDVDGLLVGGASLDPERFAEIAATESARA
ncbi:MAG TPA: triose-phosphate isomerase [Longimicrobiales bacterium]